MTAGPVYRYSTPLEGIEELDNRLGWFQRQGGGPSDSVRRLFEAIDHRDRSILRTRPELNYEPDNPRVPRAEADYIHRIRLHIKPGTGREVAERLEQLSALRRRHNIRDARIVWSKVTGSAGFELTSFARDAADYYAQSQKNGEMMGDDFQTLVSQIMALCRRVERENVTIRRDLWYQPSN